MGVKTHLKEWGLSLNKLKQPLFGFEMADDFLRFYAFKKLLNLRISLPFTVIVIVWKLAIVALGGPPCIRYESKPIVIKGAVDQTPTFIFASSLSLDDDSSLLRLFPLPYLQQFHCC